MNPLAIKGIATLLFVLAIFMAGHHQGAKSVQGEWDAAKVVQLAETNKIIADNAARVEQLQQAYTETNRKVSNDYQTEKSKIEAERDAAITNSSKPTQRLYITAACGKAPASGPKAASISGPDATASSTIALPQQTSDDLFRLAAEADEVVAQAKALQEWIKDNGFYTTK
jgi:hypothetical protein